MAASFTIAGRNNGFSKADTRAATAASVTAYREAMAVMLMLRWLHRQASWEVLRRRAVSTIG